jgi:hypothetical protein
LTIVYISIKLQRFGSWIFFRLQVRKEGQKPWLLGSLVELASDLNSFNLDVPGAINGGQQASTAGDNSWMYLRI